jgi:predicted DNA-binding transcriptional regulator AlpA
VAIVKHLRYPDLVESGITTNRVDLGRKIKFHGFPPGRLLGPNTRAWTEPEIEQWLASRPVVRAPDAIPREQRFAGSTERPARRAAAKTAKVETKHAKPKRRRVR